jgi:hypothetical protein
MLRVLLVIGGIAVVFVVTLVVGGNVLGAWEPAKPVAAPPAKAAKPRAPVSPTRSAPKAASAHAPKRKATRPAWIATLNALCRSAEVQTAALTQPQTLAEVRSYLQRVAKLSKRWNDQAAGPLAIAARRDPQKVRRLEQLFAQEPRLIADAIAALDARALERFQQLAPRFLANGREQSRLLVGLGAEDCALPDYLQL